MSTWERGAVELSIGVAERPRVTDKEVRRETVSAHLCGPFAVHKGAWGYQVTHVPTGRRLVDSIPTLPKAKRFCEDVRDLTDWSRVTPGLCPPEIKPALLAALAKARP